MPFLVIGLSHHTAPVTLRERFSFAEARVPVTDRGLLFGDHVFLQTATFRRSFIKLRFER